MININLEQNFEPYREKCKVDFKESEAERFSKELEEGLISRNEYNERLRVMEDIL